MKENKKNTEAIDRYVNLAKRISRGFTSIIRELYYGVTLGTIPYFLCYLPTLVIDIATIFHLDKKLYHHYGWTPFYLGSTVIFWLYHFVVFTLGFWGWGLYRVGRKYHQSKMLNKLFDGIGLKNAKGEPPRFVADFPIDDVNRCLRLQRNLVPESRFNENKGAIEGALQVIIENIEDELEKGLVNLYYTKKKMPGSTILEDVDGYANFTFRVGETRSKYIVGSLMETPHLLVAGESNGGKSTFLRQFIATIYLNNKNVEFFLIDLKGNLEFQFFEDLNRITVINESENTLSHLNSIKFQMQDRFRVLREAGAKDFNHYEEIRQEREKSNDPSVVKLMPISRIIIVIDEIAELFYSSKKTSNQNSINAREISNKVARQGRALGIHLVIATQRPDAVTLDPQIKANLSGVLAFRIANHASSMTILDNGRAAKLPKIPGRAIWKIGGTMMEVQTPFLDTPILPKLFKAEKEVTPPKEEDSIDQNQVTDPKPQGPLGAIQYPANMLAELGEKGDDHDG